MKENKVGIRAVAAPWYSGVDMQIRCDDAICGRLVFTTQENDCLVNEPTLSIRMTEAQILMDDLWNAGIRPTEGTGSAGSLRATEKHLDDMRKIAFKGLDLEG